MPELPEVETIRRGVEPRVIGRKIIDVEIIDKRNIKGISPALLKKRLLGEKVVSVKREAKYLLFEMASGKYLVVHLGMTGRLLFKSDGYVKVIFHFSGGKSLYYSDARLFGKIRLFDKHPELKLGPDPLLNSFKVADLKKILGHRNTSVKVLLLDQKLIAGIGNIYANEALFRAGIHPARKANTLSDKEIMKLHDAIRSTLSDGVKYRGTSDSWYIDADGEKGAFQDHLKVYRKGEEPCLKCKTKIKRIVIGQRGTYYCPRCQK
ncbi:MAG: bifunctional DNA-formamidopyrimidine glycosylase/DNA-(apurinic or apyrimidinic site) lyase [Candidatus Margulisiibacteriota bacterium]